MQRHLIATVAATLVAAANAHADGYGRGFPDNNAFLPAAPMTMGASASTKMVGGAAMYPTRDIIDNAVNSRDHTTLVAAVKAAGLVDTLKTPGPFTVFAPTNMAFGALPAGTVDTLLKPENKAMLVQILTAHVVAGTYDTGRIRELLRDGGGRGVLETVSGDLIALEMRGDDLYVIDENAHGARVTIADVDQSNGVIHVVDGVLLPAS